MILHLGLDWFNMHWGEKQPQFVFDSFFPLPSLPGVCSFIQCVTVFSVWMWQLVWLSSSMGGILMMSKWWRSRVRGGWVCGQMMSYSMATEDVKIKHMEISRDLWSGYFRIKKGSTYSVIESNIFNRKSDLPFKYTSL